MLPYKLSGRIAKSGKSQGLNDDILKKEQVENPFEFIRELESVALIYFLLAIASHLTNL